VRESPANRKARQAGGNRIVSIDPAAFKRAFEAAHQGPLAYSPQKAAALQQLASVDQYPEVTGSASSQGIDVADGRHRIAEAARRGQASLPVQIAPGDQLPAGVLERPPTAQAPRPWMVQLRDWIQAHGKGGLLPGQAPGATVDADARPTTTTTADAGNLSAGNGAGPASPETPRGGGQAGAGTSPQETTILLNNATGRSYNATYKVKELADLQPSHSGVSFGENPNYELKNDRDYTKPENQAKVFKCALPQGAGGTPTSGFQPARPVNMAAPLARVESDPQWNLTPIVQGAPWICSRTPARTAATPAI